VGRNSKPNSDHGNSAVPGAPTALISVATDSLVMGCLFNCVEGVVAVIILCELWDGATNPWQVEVVSRRARAAVSDLMFLSNY